MKRILVAGEINVDLILQGYESFPTPGKEVLVRDSLLALGSASAICAVGLARLGDPVAFIGKLGCDTWGDYCLHEMAAAGVDVSAVLPDPGLKTGLTVSLASFTDRALVTYIGSIDALSAADVADGLLQGSGHLHVSSYYLQRRLRPGCRELFARARRLGLTTSLDCGFDPTERWEPDLLATLQQVDLFFPNEVELAAVTGLSDPSEALRALQNGRTRTVAKLGPRGCMTLDGSTVLHVEAFAVQPVDTTGAGDSFNAGFLHGFLHGKPLRDCLRYGTACGALSTRGLGGTASQPDARELEHFIGGRS